MMHTRARRLGLLNSHTDIGSRESITEALTTYREISVKNRQSHYVQEVSKARMQIANILAENNFMPYMSKYVIESTVVVAALLISATQFLLTDAIQAIGTLSVFLAAGTRIAPAILRLQQGAIQIQSGLGTATTTLQMIEELKNLPLAQSEISPFRSSHTGFIPEVNISGLTLTYPGQTSPALADINLKISPGSITAIVGPSGAGKTSLIDVILGVITPDSGTVSISNRSPKQAIIDWPGSIAYVPQDVVILSTSISRNISLNPNGQTQINFEQIRESIKKSQLEAFVKDLVEGPESFVGERGSKLSGGQRQRLGISRALYSNPKLIIMDEATSSLDAETEYTLNETIQKLRGGVTIVVIAHRLATVRNADIVCYINNGTIEAQGSFEEVRKQVHNFDKQAKLLGL